MSNHFKDLLPLIAATLYSVQATERLIIQSIVLVFPDQSLSTSEDVVSYQENIDKDALGSLLKRVRKTVNFSSDFESRVEAFRTDRNLFMHHLLEAEGGIAPPPGPMPKTEELALRLSENAIYVRNTFADLIVRWAEQIELQGSMIDAFRELISNYQAGSASEAFMEKKDT